MLAGSRTSSGTGTARGRRAATWVSSSARFGKSARATVAPCSANAAAIACPSPPAPPVMNATLPVNSSLSMVLLSVPCDRATSGGRRLALSVVQAGQQALVLPRRVATRIIRLGARLPVDFGRQLVQRLAHAVLLAHQRQPVTAI